MKIFYSLIVLALSFSYSFCQTKQLIDVEFTDARFEDVIKKIEQQTNYRFFFNPQWTDSLKVSISVRNQALPQVMEIILHDTNLKYAVDHNRNVFITERREIMADLPEDFFGETTARRQEAAAFDYSDYE